MINYDTISLRIRRRFIAVTFSNEFSIICEMWWRVQPKRAEMWQSSNSTSFSMSLPGCSFFIFLELCWWNTHSKHSGEWYTWWRMRRAQEHMGISECLTFHSLENIVSRCCTCSNTWNRIRNSNEAEWLANRENKNFSKGIVENHVPAHWPFFNLFFNEIHVRHMQTVYAGWVLGTAHASDCYIYMIFTKRALIVYYIIIFFDWNSLHMWIALFKW